MRNSSCSCNRDNCPECNPWEHFGPINPNVPCACSSSFKIRQRADINIVGQGTKAGFISILGTICPECNNETSNFHIGFNDLDLSEGNHSFRLSPVSIEPFQCSQSGNMLTQIINYSGIYKTAEGNSRLVIGQLTINQNSVSYSIRTSDFDLIAEGTVVSPATVTITQCS